MKFIKLMDVGMYLVFAGWLVTMRHELWGVRYLVGMGIGFVGIVLWIVAREQLGESFSVSAQARKLVTTGLYSKIRNPIYFFAGIAAMGLFIAWGKIIPLICIMVFNFLMQFARAKRESQVLEAAFGDEYRQYKAKTWF